MPEKQLSTQPRASPDTSDLDTLAPTRLKLKLQMKSDGAASTPQKISKACLGKRRRSVNVGVSDWSLDSDFDHSRASDYERSSDSSDG